MNNIKAYTKCIFFMKFGFNDVFNDVLNKIKYRHVVHTEVRKLIINKDTKCIYFL